MKKVFFSDMDGTILNKKSQISEYTTSVVKDVLAQGHDLYIVTGRGIENAKELLAAANLSEIQAIGGNGTQYPCPESGATISETLNPEMAREVGQKFLDKNLLFHYSGVEENYYSKPKDRLTQLMQTIEEDNNADESEKLAMFRHIYTDFVESVQSFTEITPDMELDQVIKMEIHGTKENLVVAREIASQYPNLRIDSSHPNNLECYSPNCSKGIAVNRIIATYDEPIETYAFGDNMNDYSMFEVVDHPVAMDNAVDPLKAISKSITINHDEDGVAHFIAKVIK